MKKLVQGLVLAFLALGSAQGSALAATATSCTTRSQATLLNFFSDNAGPATIVPSMVRDLICSVLVGQTAGQAPIPVTLTSLVQVYIAPSSGTLYVFGGQIELSRDNGSTWYQVSRIGGQFPLLLNDQVRISVKTLPDGTVVPMPIFFPSLNTLP